MIGAGRTRAGPNHYIPRIRMAVRQRRLILAGQADDPLGSAAESRAGRPSVELYVARVVTMWLFLRGVVAVDQQDRRV